MSDPSDKGTEDDVVDGPESHLRGMGDRFLLALAAKEKNDIDTAADLLRSILRVDPRLAEPQMELARILMESEQLEEAEEYAREAVKLLEGGGQWTEDLPENVVLSAAWSVLAEVLRQRADTDEMVFGDAEAFAKLMAETRAAFVRAAELDPTNEHAVSWAYGFDPAAAAAEQVADHDETPEA